VLDWAREHQGLLWWLGGASAVLFAAALLATPAVLARIPADYFAHERRPPRRGAGRAAWVRVALAVGRNALGAVLLVAGAAMLALPGPGLVTLLLGFLLIDAPGKYRAERWLVSRPRVLRAINWVRGRRGRAPLVTAAA